MNWSLTLAASQRPSIRQNRCHRAVPTTCTLHSTAGGRSWQRLERRRLRDAAREGHEALLEIGRADAHPPLVEPMRSAQLVDQQPEGDALRLDLVHQRRLFRGELAIAGDLGLNEGFHVMLLGC